MTDRKTHIDIVFDGPPSHESGRFVEVEDASGKSINFGEWIKREDGFWVLRFPDPRGDSAPLRSRMAGMEEAAKIVEDHYWDSTGAVGKVHGDAIAAMIRRAALSPSTETK